MPHASFCLRAEGHFSKRNIRSLFLVLILRAACHTAFTFCPYIWICSPSCAFEEGMQTLFFNFSEAVGHCQQPAACSGRTSHVCALAVPFMTRHPLSQRLLLKGLGQPPQPPDEKRLFPGVFLSCPFSLPSQPIKPITKPQWMAALCLAQLFPPHFFLLALVASGKWQKLLFPYPYLLWEAPWKCWQSCV